MNMVYQSVFDSPSLRCRFEFFLFLTDMPVLEVILKQCPWTKTPTTAVRPTGSSPTSNSGSSCEDLKVPFQRLKIENGVPLPLVRLLLTHIHTVTTGIWTRKELPWESRKEV